MKNRITRRVLLPLLLAGSAGLVAGSAAAANFTVASGTDNVAKTLAAGETGSVSAGATLSVSGSGNAITLSGTSGTTTVTNSGNILQTGTGRTLRNNTSGTPAFSITNNAGALIRSADADTIRADVAGSSWLVVNSGTISSLNPSLGGSQAIDFDAVTTGNVSISNNATGHILAYAADAIRPGANAVIVNAGEIAASLNPADTAPGSDGIDVQARSNVSVTNTGTINGRHGITGGVTTNTVFSTSVTNNAGGVIQGLNGSGINLDGGGGLQTATVVNYGSIIGNGTLAGSDGDGIDVDGLITLTNTGIIRSLNAFSAIPTMMDPTPGPAFSEGLTVGGGSIANSGTIEGLVASGNTNAVGRGITLSGNDITTGPLAGTREGIYADTTVTNQTGGLIRGQSDSGIVAVGAASGFTVKINNNAGATIQGGGASSAAIQTGMDNDTIINAGTIDGSSSGKAIDMGGGVNTLTISGAATVLGNISGGSGSSNTMTLAIGAGNDFTYAGSISNFNTVTLASGHATLSGPNAYTGGTVIAGGRLTLDGINRIAAGSALDLAGVLELLHSGANGQTFASLTLSDNSTIDLESTASLTLNALGGVGAGKSLSVVNFSSAASPDYAIRFLGNITGDASFLNLMAATTINGLAAGYSYSSLSGYTNVVATPLPGALLLLLSGLGGLGAATRRRRSGNSGVQGATA